MISAKDFNDLVKNATKQELQELIIAGINEVIPFTKKQILKLLELKRGL